MDASLKPYPWQQIQWQQLQKQITQDSIPHALLLVGSLGIGLDYFAQLLAQSLLCTHRGNADAPCGDCPSCRQFSQDVCPDYLYIGLLEDKKQLLVDQIRSLNEFVNLTSSGVQHKVIVISPADRMNINAANSLLKTLEEPSGEAVLILVAHHLHWLPATIKSRCQMIKFGQPDEALSTGWLTSQGHQNVEQLLQLSQYAPCLADKRDDKSLFQQYSQVAEGGLGLLAGQVTIPQIRQTWKIIEISEILDWSVSLLRDCIRVTSYLPDTHIENAGYLKNLRDTCQSVNCVDLFRGYDQLLRINDSLDHPLNADLLLDDVLLTWHSMARKTA